MLAPFTKKMVVRVSMKDKFYDSEVYMLDEDEDGTYWLLTTVR